LPQLRKVQGPTLNLLVYAWRIFVHRRYFPLLYRKFIREFTQQTVLGFWWLVFRATLPTLGLIVILGNFEALQNATIPYGVHVIGGMILWAMMPIGLRRGIRCFSQSRRLLMQHQFPRMLVAMAGFAVPSIYFAIFALVAVGLLVYYWLQDGILYLSFGPRMLLAPVAVFLVYLLLTGLSAILGIMFLMARDLRFAIPAITQVWFLATPIIYPLTFVPEPWPTVILYLNPMAGIIEALRWSLFGVETTLAPYIYIAAAECAATFLLGLWIVMRAEILMEDLY
jgi:lipopolysaccharide transport system permease protein